jgi:[acyl-carrier-protein] S-malonyltransferase
MVEKAAFLFPGQGSQFAGMALDFEAASPVVRELFATASEIMGRDMKALIAEGDEATLKQTDIAQVAVTLANLAAAAALAERGIFPVAVAGHSLGEYAALAAAGCITPAACLSLVRERGRAMHEAVGRLAARGGYSYGMAAVLGLPPEKVEALIAQFFDAAEAVAKNLNGEGGAVKKVKVYAANFNSVRQTVISGTNAALSEAEIRFKEAGAKRVLRLKVSGPFHCPLMSEAAQIFAGVLEAARFAEPKVHFFSNVTGREVKTAAEAKALAVMQITHPVRWTEEEAEIAKLPLDAVLETGPGTVLCGLWKDSGSAVPALAAGKLADFEKICKQ